MIILLKLNAFEAVDLTQKYQDLLTEVILNGIKKSNVKRADLMKHFNISHNIMNTFDK